MKVNNDDNPAIGAAHRVMAVPTMLLFHGGEPVWSVVGARPKAKLLRDLDDALSQRRG